MALTMVFLASKVEESPRKLRDVILKGLSIRFKSSEVFSESSPEYLKLYDRVLQLEKMALAVLCFDLTIDHPFRHIARLFNSHPSSIVYNYEFRIIIYSISAFYYRIWFRIHKTYLDNCNRILLHSNSNFISPKTRRIFPFDPRNVLEIGQISKCKASWKFGWIHWRRVEIKFWESFQRRNW